jgi:hypothetical protein
LEVDHKEDNAELNARDVTSTFRVANANELCRFLRLVNIERNHFGDDCLVMSSWEIFGWLIE